jgi:N-acetylglucosaminyldiphosphoundecaprenol N-acetyl-beta-D-mannosaminyltransferase
LSAAAAAVSPGLHPPGLDRAFPAVKVDYECRPYELGWLLYAWLPSPSPAERSREIRLPQDPSAHRARSRVFGLQLDALTLPEVVDMCESCIDDHSSMTVGVVNAAKVVNLRSDEVLRDSLVHCDVLLADGQSVVWASRLLGEPLPERVAGIDLFEALLERGDRERRSVYLLGAKPEILARLVDVIGARWPGLRILGSRDGYFNDDEAPEVAAEIAASGADMLFLGMTSPKKEIFLAKYGAELGIPVLHGVGGSFDVLAGVTRRAPIGWQRLGLEWAYRLAQEPRRMWRRYLRTNSAFLGLLVRERVHPTPLYLRTPTVPLGG